VLALNLIISIMWKWLSNIMRQKITNLR